MHKISALFFALLIALSLGACAAIASALPVINSALTDTTIVLKGIETAFDAYQVVHPVAPIDRARYAMLLASAYHDLQFGERAVADLGQVNQGQYDQAFGDFEQSFLALTDFLKEKGITPASSGLVGVGEAGSDTFPTPRVIGLRVHSS